jgi:hypothetical protein
MLWVSTDVDDFLRGTPLLQRPCVEMRGDGGVVVHPTYRQAGWHEASPWWKPDGIRGRIGMRHLPLSELINAFIGAGFLLDRAVEPGTQPVPYAIAVRARRPAL